MSDDAKQAAIVHALRVAAPIALKHEGELTEKELEAILLGLVEALPGREGEIASRSLFHLREQRRTQLELVGVLTANNAPLIDGNGAGKS